MSDDTRYETHESYGMMRFSRTSGHAETLFGSSIQHSELINLSISPGSVKRDLNNDWYHADGASHIEVEMSHSQFSEAITSMNMGSGVPVTIKRLNGKRVANPTFTNKRLQFAKEFETQMKDLKNAMTEFTENAKDVLTNKKTLSKADRADILRGIERLHNEIALNIPFIAEQYNEQLDKTTQEAKGEIEAFTASKLNQLGLTKLSELQDERRLAIESESDTGKQKGIVFYDNQDEPTPDNENEQHNDK